MKPVAIFLSGIAALLAGAFIRSCQQGVPSDLLNAWCGGGSANLADPATHMHCAGCVTMVVGAALVGLAFVRPVSLALRRIGK